MLEITLLRVLTVLISLGITCFAVQCIPSILEFCAEQCNPILIGVFIALYVTLMSVPNLVYNLAVFNLSGIAICTFAMVGSFIVAYKISIAS